MNNKNVLDDDRIGRLLLKMSLPVFFGHVAITLYNIVDTIFIGHYVGALGIAGLSICFPVQMLSMGIGQLSGMGGASLISRLIGAGNVRKAERALGNALISTLVFSFIVMVAGLANTDSLLRLIGASDTVLPYARDYLTIILIGLFFQTCGMAMSFLIRAGGNATVPMIGMVLGAVLNITLDAIFIIQLGMGIKGAALATIIAQMVSVGYFISYYLSGKSYLKLHLYNFIIEWTVLREILAIGIAAFTMTMSTSVSIIFINRVLNIYGGDLAVSTFGIINRLVLFAIIPSMVVGQGLQPVLGFNYGAKRYDRALKSMGIAIAVATFFSISAFLFLYFLPGPLIRVFTMDSDLIALGIYAAKRVFFLVYLVGFIMVCSITFQSLGKAVQSFITSVSRSALILLPCVLILPRYFQLDGVWMTFPVTDALTLILVLILIIPQIRDLRRMDLLEKEKKPSRMSGTNRDVQPVVITGEYNKE